MDWATFVVRIVEAIAWPTVVGFAFWNLRAQFGSLIAKVRRAKWKDAEVTFGEELDRVEDRLATPPKATGQAPELQQLAVEARLPPAYIIQQAWLGIERALSEAAKRRGIVTGTIVSPKRLVHELQLSPEDQALVHQIRKLRNDAVHVFGPTITVTDALRYKDIAESLVRRIEGDRSSDEEA
jgi:hypothetical protein